MQLQARARVPLLNELNPLLVHAVIVMAVISTPYLVDLIGHGDTLAEVPRHDVSVGRVATDKVIAREQFSSFSVEDQVLYLQQYIAIMTNARFPLEIYGLPDRSCLCT